VAAGTRRLIFVVDSNDRWPLDDAREQLKQLLDSDDLHQAVLLVCANKQDLPGAVAPQDLVKRLSLNRIVGRPWHVQPTCALTGDGLLEGLKWLGEELSKGG
jgi:signal recognition particle receptor subunit beta